MQTISALLLFLICCAAFAQQAPEYPLLSANRFSPTGYTDSNGTEHKIIIEKPDAIYNRKSVLPMQPHPKILPFKRDYRFYKTDSIPNKLQNPELEFNKIPKPGLDQ